MILLHRLAARDFKQLADVTIDFPDSGTVLIEGENEAGKSSLFEAVYFALYGKSLNGVNIPDLRRFGAEMLRVELEFSVHGERFVIERTVRQNQSVQLTCLAPDGGSQLIRGATEVTKRLFEETGLSASALLNTCYVEQKRLDNLEKMDRSQRLEAINELLNLKTLTALDAVFKITKEDEEDLQQSRKQVQVGELDAALPALVAAERKANRCLTYHRLLQRIEEMRVVDEAIEADLYRQDEAQNRLEEIGRMKDIGARLQRTIEGIDGDLDLRAKAWREAIRTYDQAAIAAEELQALVADLPIRREQADVQNVLMKDLEALESLEVGAAQWEMALQDVRERLALHDALDTKWNTAEQEKVRLDGIVQRQKETVQRAQECWEAREAAAKRDLRLSLLDKHAQTGQAAMKEIEALVAHLRQTETIAIQWEVLTERLSALEDVETRLKKRDNDAKALKLAQENLSAALRRKEEYDLALRRVEDQEAAGQSLEANARELRDAEQAAAQAERVVRQRSALSEWATAAEHCSLSDPNSEIQTELETRRQRLDESLKQADERIVRSRRRMTPGLIATGVAIVGGGVGGAIGFVIGLIPAVVLLIVGILLLFRARQELNVAQREKSVVTREIDQLDGERRGAQSLLDAQVHEKERWQEKQSALLIELHDLGVNAPVTPAEAYRQAAALPATSVAEACAARVRAEQDRQRCDNALELLRLDSERARHALMVQDPQALIASIQTLGQERTRLEAAIDACADLLGVIASLGVTLTEEHPNSDLQATLTQVRREVAVSQAAQDRIPEINRQIEAKHEDVSRETEAARAVAIECAVSGETLGDWIQAAAQDRAMLETARELEADEVLRQAFEQASRALNTFLSDLAVFNNEQDRRTSELQASPRAKLESEEASATASIETSRKAQTPLRDVREKLSALGLPSQTASLHTELAVRAAKLIEDEERAAHLQEALKELQSHDEERKARSDEWSRAWRALLSDSLPPATPRDAMEALPPIRAEFVVRLEDLDLKHVGDEETRLQAETRRLGENVAALGQERKTVQAQQDALMEALEDLHGDPQTLSTRFPELVQTSEHTEDEWRQECEERSAAVWDNRNERRSLAISLSLEQLPIDLEMARQSHAEKQKALDVKRRAGWIVAHTRKTIVEHVMPLTLNNVRQLLPLLTQGRYRDLEWNGDANILMIYDSRAGGYQSKKVFSGGAKDQISLALRLGFALATLPTGSNVRPGWLFLDEPLSSFDRRRTLALVDLLTRGLVRKEFAQIFLVSHSESFDPDRFDYRIRMENGIIAESSLPPQASVEAVISVKTPQLA